MIVFLYCLSLLISPVIFCYFFLLFCISLVYLWYSLIPSRVLSNHPPLSPSSPPISFRHLPPCNFVPSLQLCPLPATPSPPENRPLLRNHRLLPEPPPPPENPTSSVQCSAISRRVYFPPPKKNLPSKVTTIFSIAQDEHKQNLPFSKISVIFFVYIRFF